MSSARARLLTRGQVILGDIAVELKVGDSGPASPWGGYFQLAQDPRSLGFKPGGSHSLEFLDGRSGEIEITDVRGAPGVRCVVSFVGTTPLS